MRIAVRLFTNTIACPDQPFFAFACQAPRADAILHADTQGIIKACLMSIRFCESGDRVHLLLNVSPNRTFFYLDPCSFAYRKHSIPY
jgi:hypothetical protein